MKLLQGDCLDILKTLEDNSIDAIVTDPPYGLVSINKRWSGKEVKNTPGMETKEGSVWARKAKGFMGKEWDGSGIEYNTDMWRECYRVLKPGGYLLAFTGTRTYHKIASAIDDAGFEIRDMIMYVYGSGFPKSLNIGKSVNQLETNEWSKIGKALDNIDKKNIIEVWKSNSDNVKIVETQSLKNQITVGQDTLGENFVVLNVVQNSNQENSNLLVSFAEQNLNEVQAISTKTNTALQNVEIEIRQLQNLAKSAEQLSQDQNHRSWNIFTAQCDVKEFLNENTDVSHKVDEALKTLRGNKKYSNEEITSVLCAVIPSVLKLTILNQSKTFQNLDTNQKMECASATNVIITEYTAENLISNTVDILKGKAIDKLQGNEREVIGKKHNTYDGSVRNPDNHKSPAELSNIGKWGLSKTPHGMNETKGTSEWEGWGTALKPALEPITVARKPIEGNVAQNCLKWGVGGINIDECRVGTEGGETHKGGFQKEYVGEKVDYENHGVETDLTPKGRFPANLILDGSDEVVELFPNSNGSGKARKLNRSIKPDQVGWGMNKNSPDEVELNDAGSGSAARFFYCAKASKSERNRGCEGLDKKEKVFNGKSDKPSEDMKGVEKKFTTQPKANNHPTVKPISLMEYLIKLVSREGHTILDPFAGSFTTGIACINLDRKFIGIERDPEYFKIGKARIDYVIKKKSSSLFSYDKTGKEE